MCHNIRGKNAGNHSLLPNMFYDTDINNYFCNTNKV